MLGIFSTSCGSTLDTQAKMFFDNGYGVSVITGTAAHDNYEVAIIRGTNKHFNICYDTPISDEVIACSTKQDVSKIMKQVQEL